MAIPALPRPDMPAPQPVEATKVSNLPPAGRQAALFLRVTTGETGDRLFKFAMLLCGLAVLATLGLIVYELMLRSGPSWHAFGFKFFAGHDWDPVNEQFGAMPFIYGTLVSSLIALLIAVPLSIGVAVFTTEMCPRALRGPLFVFRGIAGRDLKRGLRTVGNLCPRTAPQQLHSTFPVQDIGLDWVV